MRDERGNNCAVLGTSAEAATHVTRQTPMQTKKKEIEGDPQYQAKAMDPKREAAVTKARRENNVRPLDGGIAR